MLAASAGLTDYQKMVAELFDDKFRSLGFSALFLLQSRGLSLEQFVHLDFLFEPGGVRYRHRRVEGEIPL